MRFDLSRDMEEMDVTLLNLEFFLTSLAVGKALCFASTSILCLLCSLIFTFITLLIVCSLSLSPAHLNKIATNLSY